MASSTRFLSRLMAGRGARGRRLRTLTTLLRAPDPATRIEALERAHALPPAERAALAVVLQGELTAGLRTPPAQALTVWFIRQILALLGDSRVQVRMDAAHVLREYIGRTPSREPVDPGAIAPAVAAAVELAGGVLISDAEDREQTRVLAFAEMLAGGLRAVVIGIQTLERGGEELNMLGAAMHDRNPRVRRSLCEVLVAMGGDRAIELLLPLLQDPNPSLRARAAQALGELKAVAASAGLRRLLQDPVSQVRAAAAGALAELQVAACDEVLAALAEECRREDGTEAARTALTDAAAVLADGPSPSLSSALSALPRPAAARLAAALERHEFPAARLVDPHWREEAPLLADLLARLADLGVTRPFLEALDAADLAVRTRAAAALGSSREPEALAALVGLLGDPEAAVRTEAVASVARTADPRALSPLSQAASDPDPAVRQAAISGLRQVLLHRSEWRMEALPPEFDLKPVLAESHRALLHAASDPQAHVRVEAVGGLGLFTSTEAAEALVALALADDAPAVRAAAREALAGGGFPQLRRLLAPTLDDADERRRARAMSVLGAVGGGEAGRHLLEAFHDPSADVREAALLALARLPAESLPDRLAAELKNPDPRLRAGAAGLLGKARASEHVEALVQALADPEEEVRVNALNALAGLGRAVRRHQHELSARLSDPSPRVREVAATALGVLRESWAAAADVGAFIGNGSLTPTGAAMLVEMATDGDLDPLLRALDTPNSAHALAEFLSGAGWSKLRPLVAALRQAERQEQTRGLTGLSQALRGSGATGYLTELRSLDPEVRMEALETAGLLATPDALRAIIELLERDPVLQVRSRAASVLADIPDDAARAALQRAQANDPSKPVRLAATRALGQSRSGLTQDAPTDDSLKTTS